MSKWPLLPLGDIVEFDRKGVRPEMIVSGTIYVGLENIVEGGELLNVNSVNKGDLASAKFAFTQCHILYGKLRPYLSKIARPNVDGICSTDIIPLLPSARIDRDFLTHFLRLDSSVSFAADRAVGVNLPRLSPSVLATLPVPVPNLPEQRRIAAILDQAEALRAKRREALAKLDTLTQSLFLEMFGDPLQESSKWPTQRIDSFCKLVRGSSPRPQGDPRFYGGRIPRLMVADLTRDGWLVHPRIDSLTPAGAALSRPVPAGTVVMAVSGNVGLVSMLAVDACIHDGFVGFTQLAESRIEPRYLVTLLYLLKVTHEQRKAGAIFQNLTTSDVKAMQIPVPSVELQRTFLRRLESLDKLANSAKQSRGKIDRLFASVQHRAFQGEL